MQSSNVFLFDVYRLDLRAACLWRGDEKVRLTAKAFAVLHYLVMRAGRLITRDELFDQVWGTPYVTEAALAACIREIRRSLDDRAQQPQFVETVRGRGYRFLASVHTEMAPSPLAWPEEHDTEIVAGQVSAAFAGREAELDQLYQYASLAAGGSRQVLFITGEAGIGKTALVDAFVQGPISQQAAWINYGHCIDQYGNGEPYLPLLEAFGQILRGPDRQILLDILQQYAPSWLLQFPAFLSDEEFESVQRRATGATRERMLRELAEAVEMLTVRHPLVLILEDLHWSDVSTLDWLAYIARRRQRARLLIIGTYRPVDAVVREHPVRAVAQELRVHGWCIDMPLDYLTASGVSIYLSRRFHQMALPSRLASSLHHRTNGSPLFLVTLVDELEREGLLSQEMTEATLIRNVEAMATVLPTGLQQLLTHQLDQLTPDEQELLEAASAVGKTFATAAVAACLEKQEAEIDEHYAHLARQGRFVRAEGVERWPDGSITSQYGFMHDLYRETAYSRVPLGRLTRWHHRIGLSLERAYRDQAHDIAAELARHFVSGQDPPKALTYLYAAGKQALRRSALLEATAHFKQSLALLQTLPESPEHHQRELALLNAYGQTIMAAHGAAAPEAEHIYNRVLALCLQNVESPELSRALGGLWVYYLSRTAYQKAFGVAQQLYRLAQLRPEPIPLIAANQTLGITLFFLGRLTEAHRYLDEGCAIYTAQGSPSLASRTGHEFGVQCFSYMGVLLSMQGYLEQAVPKHDRGLALAREFAHPYSLGLVLILGAILFQHRREHHAVHELAQASIDLVTEHQFPAIGMMARMLQGWSLAQQDQVEMGIAQMQQGLIDYVESGLTVGGRVFWHFLLAETYGQTGQVEAGLAIVNDELAHLEHTDERFWEAELYRLKGDLLLAQSSAHLTEATAHYQRAIHIAQSQAAKLWELRATTSMARLQVQIGKRQAAQALLTPVYRWFTEGFDTADLQAAKRLLDT